MLTAVVWHNPDINTDTLHVACFHSNVFESLKSKSSLKIGIFLLCSSLSQALYSGVTSAAGHGML